MNLEQTKEKLQHLIDQNPFVAENNTTACIYLWEYVAQARGIDVNDWMEMKAIMRDYPPESITRARRDITRSTYKQREAEAAFEDYFRPDHC